jgi:hypothetical protein
MVFEDKSYACPAPPIPVAIDQIHISKCSPQSSQPNGAVDQSGDVGRPRSPKNQPQCRHYRVEPLRPREFSVFRFLLFAPAAKFKSDGCAGRAQFICKRAVDHGPRHDHAPNGQGSDGLCSRMASSAALFGQTPLQDAHHRLEDGLKSALCAYAAA